MIKFPKLKSDFALLDVKRGRFALRRFLKKNGPQTVTVTMTLLYDAGNDDGESIEFAADVHKVTVGGDK
jgi:hypothetical protein